MRLHRTMIALVLAAGIGPVPTSAQVVSPLGGSTTNPQSPPPATARPSATTPAPAATSAARPTTTAAPTAAPAATPTASAPAATAPAHTRKTFAERFADANTTHDGKMTLEQARTGHMRSIIRDFDKIDKDKKGYVTLDQVKAHQAESRAATRAQRAAATH